MKTSFSFVVLKLTKKYVSVLHQNLKYIIDMVEQIPGNKGELLSVVP